MSLITRKFFIAAALGASVLSSASADSPPPDTQFHTYYGVADWRDLVPEKASEYKTYRMIVLGNQTYSDDEKAAKIAKKYADIRSAVVSSRKEAYGTVSELRGVGNSATKGSSGGNPKKVDAKCTGASKEHMYTSAQWARGAYRSGGADANAQIFADGGLPVDPQALVADNGNVVCAIALKQSGKGRKYSYSEATFRIRPERIKAMVDAEALSMMYAISSTPI